MKISVYYDLVCPWCYLGHARLTSALAAYPADGVAVDWRPFQLAPDLDHEVTKDAYYRQRGMDPEAMRRVHKRIVELGKPLGLAFDFGRTDRIANTLDAHRLVAWAPADRRADVVEALFRGYFVDGMSLARTQDLVTVAQRCGLGTTDDVTRFLESGELADTVRAQVKEAYTLPIITVPYIVVNNRFPVQFTHLEGVAELALRNLWT